MKRYLVLLLLALVVLGFTQVACSPGLPEEEKTIWFNIGHFDGWSWGSRAERENLDIYRVSPDRVEDFQRDFYIPKGYLPIEYFATAQFPESKPCNEKQKRQACEGYN